MLTSIAEVSDSDGPAEIRSKIETLFRGSDEAAIASERLAEFLGLAGATASPEETHWAIRRLFEALAAERPLVAVIEDIHWAEPGLLDLIEHIAEWSHDAPILLVCPARPDLQDVRPGWGTSPAATTLHLDPLTRQGSDRMIAELLGGPDAPDAVRSRVVEVAEGNPLFVEQMIAMLIDDGLVRPGADGWVVTGDLSHLHVPPTIAGLLQARLDRLPPTEQRVIERGSVEGRIFHWGSVTALSHDLDPSEVGRQLMSLRRRDLIGPEQALFGGSEAFRFLHALIRDAAYERIPKRTRSELHEELARWLERTAGDRLPEFEEVLAYHLEQAVKLRAELGPLDESGRELAGEAAARLEASGRRATDRGDVAAAANLLGRAVALIDRDDPERTGLLWLLGTSRLEAGDRERASAALDEALEASRRAGDERMEIRARIAKLFVLYVYEPEGATAQMRQAAEEAIPILERLGDDEGLSFAWGKLCEVALMGCRTAELEVAAERAAFHAERAGDRPQLSDAIRWLVLAPGLGMMPPEDGIQRCRAMRARMPADRVVEAFADLTEGMMEGMLGRFEEARAKERHGLEILTDLGMKVSTGGMSIGVASVEAWAGDLDAAERIHRDGIELLDSIGEKGYLSTHAALLARVLYAQDRLDESEDMTRVAEEAGASDDIPTQVIWRSVRAKLLARRGLHGEALALAEEAIALNEGTDSWDVRGDALVDLGE
ncbi:MAG TPA: adenylate/guanylate cyclase domain-containing protein, partial [Actinomycetota bacterium]|nr:adenylate/guanylate cyclase domain-containing protein [Actinomycetota bacterium]